MKRFFLSIMTILFSMCFIAPLSVNAATIDDVYDGTLMDYDIWNYLVNDVMPTIQSNSSGASQSSVDNIQSAVNDVKTTVDSIDLKSDMENFYANKNTENDGSTCSSVVSFADTMIETANDYWAKIADIISDTGVNNEFGFAINVKTMKSSSIFYIFRNFAYSLVLVFFAANLIETSIKYEIFTLKGGVQVFGRLLISKVIIDASGLICIYLLDICSNLTSKILSASTAEFKINKPNLSAMIVKSDVWVVGKILDFLLAALLLIPILLIVLPILISAIFVIIKLILRSLELSLLVCVSPAFFACYSSEVTRPYFRNFIMTFIQCAAQIVFMAVVYFVGTKWFASSTNVSSATDAWTWFQNVIPNTLIAIAIAIMMVKPPRVLTNLLK